MAAYGHPHSNVLRPIYISLQRISTNSLLSFQLISFHMATVTDHAGLPEEQERKLLRIPDTMSKWPWRPVLNPLGKEVEDESKAWIKTFEALANNLRWRETIEVIRSGA